MAPGDSEVDVLIVGAGPAGLMAATWMARCGIKTRIIDKRGTKIFSGQADGLQCRTLEIFDSFGFADRVWKESNHMLEICLWNPDSEGRIRRSDRIPDTIPFISRFQQVVLHQGRIERFFLDSMKKHSDIRVERGVMPQSMTFDENKAEDPAAYPIEVTLQHLTEAEMNPDQSTSTNGAAKSDGLFRSNMAADDTEELLQRAANHGLVGSRETVKAKYLIGCDGAHSWVRRQLGQGFELEGEQTDYIWGVLDIIPITDFPDIRMRCAIHSASSGSVMVIPRENKLVRLYIQMTTTEKGGDKLDRSNITPKLILESAQRTMKPYKLDYEYCDWWTAYQIGQRVGKSFSKSTRIFLAGDAVHTHSPKAGQGMNVSMQDTYNLGWKIAGVINGTLDRKVLGTYESERKMIAEQLIEFDHKFSRLFSGRPAKDVADEAGISMSEFKEAFVKGNLFASGVAVDYDASLIVAKDGGPKEQSDGTGVLNGDKRGRGAGNKELATNIKIGQRFPSYQVLNQADARPWPFQQFLKSDGRFRIIVFAGNIVSPSQKSLVHQLAKSLEPLTKRYTPSSKPIDSRIEILTLHSSKRHDVEIFDFPELLRPWTEGEGWDYWKIFVDDESYHEGDGRAYEGYGVDKEKGCLVAARPDGYVGWVGGLEDVGDLERWFGGFMKVQE
ncbi:probable phenol 2-monooxygenase [Phialocephala subalpina]|uniref:Probable phenol 2-monooxygenase n=1 Tax=Phialocephala subalpina TaxID=576137 RepID=A0A1L7XNT7_9HELO|nr:probable phenol 2-monooxygenase [Phialocephala subalpina]